MNFLTRRAITTMTIIIIFALVVAYFNGAILGGDGKIPSENKSSNNVASFVPLIQNKARTTPLSDRVARKLRMHGFRLVDPTGKAGFESLDLNGTSQSIQQYRGKLVVLNFWATWCPPCKEEMPWMEDLWQEYKGQGLTVLALNMNESASGVRSFVKRYNLTFPVWIDD